MRPIIIGLGLAMAVSAFNPPPGHAEGYNAQWCTDGSGRGESGNPSCMYYTLEQCRAAASGRGMHCMRNPDYRPGSGDRNPNTRRRN